MSEPRPERPYMPDYGVNTPAWRALPWSWASDRLAASRNFWLVTVSAEGRPHALPVWAVWDDGEQRIAFSCGPRSRKARNLADNPRCVVANEDTVECVSVEGRASPVVGESMERWIERYLAKYSPLAPELNAEFLRANHFLVIVPERAFGIVEREDDFANRATRWVFGAEPG